MPSLGALQSLTGKYREIQGKPRNENREPAMRTGFPCNDSRYFPVGIDLQGFPVSCTGFGFAVCPYSVDFGPYPGTEKEDTSYFVSLSIELT